MGCCDGTVLTSPNFEQLSRLIAAQPRHIRWESAADWGVFTEQPISGIDNTVSVAGANGIGSVTAVSGGASGAERRLYRLDGFCAADMEVRCDLTPNAHQLGFALRLQDDVAAVAWTNVVFDLTATVLWGVWEWDGVNLTSTNQGLEAVSFPSPVVSWSGSGATVTVRTRTPHPLVVGNFVDATGLNAAFSNAETVASVPDAMTFTFADTLVGSGTGVYRLFTWPPRARCAARLVGNRLTFKSWYPYEPEPSWSDPNRSIHVTLPAVLAGSGGPPPSGVGGFGLIVAHLGPSGTVQVGDLVVRSLDVVQ